jgi:hypothetical protein
MKLHQLLAVLPTVKTRTKKALTELYQTAQKPGLFKGLSRTYSPREEGDYVYPPESQTIQVTADELIRNFLTAHRELINLAAAQDLTNCDAKADIEIEGRTIAANVPVANLLFLEKQLQDIKTFVEALPILDIDKQWSKDENRGCYSTESKQTVKTKKITDFVVAYEATEHHPAQIKEVSKDIIEGTWSLIEFSGALPADAKKRLLERVEALAIAVVKAREAANAIEVKNLDLATPIFDYLFARIN